MIRIRYVIIYFQEIQERVFFNIVNIVKLVLKVKYNLNVKY